MRGGLKYIRPFKPITLYPKEKQESECAFCTIDLYLFNSVELALEAREMAQQLRALDALTEDLGLTPDQHDGSQAPVTLVPRTLFTGSPRHQKYPGTQIYLGKHLYSYNKINKSLVSVEQHTWPFNSFKLHVMTHSCNCSSSRWISERSVWSTL